MKKSLHFNLNSAHRILGEPTTEPGKTEGLSAAVSSITDVLKDYFKRSAVSAILNHPSLLSRIAVAHPVVATGIFFFGAGVAIGDLINKGIEELEGESPGGMLVDAFMD